MVKADVSNWNGLNFTGLLHRADRVFGGPQEGWTAVVNVYAGTAQASATPPQPIPSYSFNVPFPYVAWQDPIQAADAAIEAALQAQAGTYSNISTVA